jgi:type I restriction enzyme S subunit
MELDSLTESTLAEVCSLVTDGTHDTPKRVASGYPLIKAKEITGGRIDFETCDQISKEEHLAVIARSKPECGDTLFAHIGASLGEAAFVNTTREFSIKNVALFKPNRAVIDARYLYYLVISPAFQALAKGTKTGSAQPFLGLSQLRGHCIRYHRDLPTQRRIGAILSAYDELMENSQRRIRILEAMARALYREWFVHFRFPGHEKLPRVASPLGYIPQGWEVANLDTIKGEQPHAINGGPFGSKLCTRDYVAEFGVPVIRGSNLCESGRFNPREFVFVSKAKAAELHPNLAKPGDIVVTQRGTLGQIGMIPSGIGYDSFVISQSQMKITVNPKKVSREYVFFFLRSEEANQRIKNLASSSGVPHINLAVLREFKILLPPVALQTKFGEFAISTEATIEALTRQVENLRRTRDLLLPRLLSGQQSLKPLDP